MLSLFRGFRVLAVFALIGCAEEFMRAADNGAAGDVGDEGFSRDTVDVEQAAPAEWTQCLEIADGRLAASGEGRRFEPGADIQIEITLTNLCDVDIVSYPGIRLTASSPHVEFGEPILYLYGILGFQSLVLGTEVLLEAGAEDGESIEFVAEVTRLGCEDEENAEANEENCDDLTEGYRFDWRVGAPLDSTGL